MQNPSKGITRATLIAALIGNTASQKQLTELLYPVAKHAIRGLTIHGDAEDLVQDILERIFSKGASSLLRWDPERGVGYLCKIARNVAIDQLRSVGKRQALLPYEDESDSHHDAVREYEAKAEYRVLAQEVLHIAETELDGDDFTILRRRVLLEDSAKTVARALGMSEACVNTRKHRAVAALRKVVDAGVAERRRGFAKAAASRVFTAESTTENPPNF